MRLHNRLIKASFWNDPDTLQWPREQRWFYMGLAQLADDSGCVEDSPFAYKLLLFPSPLDADITIEKLTDWRNRLVECGRAVPYAIGGKTYLFLKNFHKHQTLDKPTPPSKASIPLPPWITWEQGDSRRRSKYAVREMSGTSPGQVPAKSPPSPRHVRVELEPELEPELELIDVPIGTNVCSGPTAENPAETGGAQRRAGRGRHDYTPEFEQLDVPIGTNVCSGPTAENPAEAGGAQRRAGRGRHDYTPEFEQFWAAYPRRVEKLGAFAAWKGRIKEAVKPEDLIRAASAYARQCTRERTEERHIKHPKTFLGRTRPYEDYLVPATAGGGKSRGPRRQVTQPDDDDFYRAVVQ